MDQAARVGASWGLETAVAGKLLAGAPGRWLDIWSL
jgi:hypothetical protein